MYPLAYFWLALWCLLVALILLTNQMSPFTGLHLITCVERKRRCTCGTLWRNGSASDSSSEGCMFNSCRGHPKASSVSALKVNLGALSYKLVHRKHVNAFKFIRVCCINDWKSSFSLFKKKNSVIYFKEVQMFFSLNEKNKKTV